MKKQLELLKSVKYYLNLLFYCIILSFLFIQSFVAPMFIVLICKLDTINNLVAYLPQFIINPLFFLLFIISLIFSVLLWFLNKDIFIFFCAVTGLIAIKVIYVYVTCDFPSVGYILFNNPVFEVAKALTEEDRINIFLSLRSEFSYFIPYGVAKSYIVDCVTVEEIRKVLMENYYSMFADALTYHYNGVVFIVKYGTDYYFIWDVIPYVPIPRLGRCIRVLLPYLMAYNGLCEIKTAISLYIFLRLFL